MLFENRDAAVRVYNVVHYKDENARSHMTPRSFCALSIRLKGGTQIISDKKRFVLQRGDIVFFPSNVSYSRFGEQEELIVIHFELFNDDTKEILLHRPKEPWKFEELFRKALEIDGKRSEGHNFIASARLNEILALIQQERGMKQGDNVIYSKAMHLIEQHYKNPQFTIATLAEQMQISERYLRSVFRKEAGLSPKKVLTDVRMQKATSLLNSGMYSVAKVAEMVGFYDSKYFATAYKKVNAVSPRVYRDNQALIDKMFSKEKGL